jgi:predicted permease
MTELLYILENISLPILLLILSGFGFQKLFRINVPTLTRLVIYLLIPVVIFVKIMEADVTWELLLTATGYMLLLQVSVYFIGQATGRLLRQPACRRSVTINSMVLINTGNYGLPLNDLVFGANPLANAAQLFIVVMQNIVTNTFGVYVLCKGNRSRKQAWLSVAKMPAMYVLALAVLLKSVGAQIPEPVMIPLNYLAGAFVAVALLALGAQLAEVRVGEGFKDAIIAGAVKVVTAPLLGFAFVLLLGVKGVLAQALIIGISTPTAVSSAALSREFDVEPGYAAQLVLMTTVLCTFTLPAVIWFTGQYFV